MIFRKKEFPYVLLFFSLYNSLRLVSFYVIFFSQNSINIHRNLIKRITLFVFVVLFIKFTSPCISTNKRIAYIIYMREKHKAYYINTYFSCLLRTNETVLFQPIKRVYLILLIYILILYLTLSFLFFKC